MKTALIILAAGKGTRMQSDLPKVLHQIAGAPLLIHALASGRDIAPERTVIVTGHGGEAVTAAAQDHDPDIETVEQSEQLGTGHAAAQAAPLLRDFDGKVAVLFGDTPHIQPETLARVMENDADLTVLGFHADPSTRYGRLIAAGDDLQAIVEWKDASEDQRAVTLCNSGVMAARAEVMFSLLDAVDDDNAAGEFYLTQIAAIARDRGMTAKVVECEEAETLGVNSRADLAAAEAAFQARKRAEMLELGVTLQAPDTVIFAYDTVIGRDVTIEPNVVFGPGVTVETGAT
ncbi:MAG: NTP transferase domain-containing protein, partial [Pseudomonadota bacterium]